MSAMADLVLYLIEPYSQEVRMKSVETTIYKARGNGKDLTVPMIMMQGKRLRDMGFTVGDRTSVTLQEGKLVVEGTDRI